MPNFNEVHEAIKQWINDLALRDTHKVAIATAQERAGWRKIPGMPGKRTDLGWWQLRWWDAGGYHSPEYVGDAKGAYLKMLELRLRGYTCDSARLHKLRQEAHDGD